MQRMVRVDRCAPELPHDAKQLDAMFVADADGYRNRNNSTEHGRPECDDKLAIGVRKYDEFVAGFHAAVLQFAEQGNGIVPQLCKRERGFVFGAVDKMNVPRFVARISQDVRQAVVQQHSGLLVQFGTQNNIVLRTQVDPEVKAWFFLVYQCHMNLLHEQAEMNFHLEKREILTQATPRTQ